MLISLAYMPRYTTIVIFACGVVRFTIHCSPLLAMQSIITMIWGWALLAGNDVNEFVAGHVISAWRLPPCIDGGVMGAF